MIYQIKNNSKSERMVPLELKSKKIFSFSSLLVISSQFIQMNLQLSISGFSGKRQFGT